MQAPTVNGPARILGEEYLLCEHFQGRFMSLGGREHPCRAIGISAHFIAVRSPYPPTIGERIVIYFENLGRFAGNVARLFAGGFALHYEATQRRREKIAERLAWLSSEPSRINLVLRQDERITPRHRASKISFHGRIYDCDIENVSRKGAALKTRAKIPIGARVELGKGFKAEVVRHIDDGFAVAFLRLLPLESFDENIRF
jgi:hypothetical protein